MSKFMYLFDFEFKRNFKNYIKIISGFCILLVVWLIGNLKDYNYIINKALRGKDPTTLSKTIGTMSFDNIVTSSETELFAIGLVVCILYSVIIWKKDFSGKSKSIYTLAMLPQDRMNIYISKFLNILCFVYMYVISFTLVLFLSYNILPHFMKGDVVSLGFIKDTIYKFGMYIPYSVETFITVYVFLLSSVISVIFTLNIGNYFMRNILKMIVVLIIGASIYITLPLGVANSIINKNLSLVICICSSLIIVVCGLISKRLLSKIDF